MRARAFLLGVVIAAAALGHWTAGGQVAQTGGSSNSNNSSSNNSSGSSNSNSNNGSSSSNNNGSSSSNNNGSSGDSGNSGGTGGGTGVTTPGGGTTPATVPGATATTVRGTPATPVAPATTIAPERVKPAKSTSCPSDVNAPGVQCYRIRPTGDPGGARLPDGRVVVLPPGPTVNVDTGASTSNDIDQVIVVNNDNRVINREPLNSRVRQWFLATIGLLVLVLVAAAVGAAIFRAGLRQGRGGGDAT